MRALVAGAENGISLFVIRSLGRMGVEVTAASHEPHAFGFSSKYASKSVTHPSPRGDETGFIDALEKELDGGGYDAVFAGSPETVLPLSKHRDRLNRHSVVPMPSHEVMLAALSKTGLAREAEAAGVPHPKTFFDLESVSDISYPVVVKPAVSYSGIGLIHVESESGLAKAYDSVKSSYGEAVIQELIYGKRYAFGGLFNKGGVPRRLCLHHRLRWHPIDRGPTVAGVTERNEDAITNCLKLLKHMKYYGVANIELIIDERDGLAKPVDLNPRFYGGLMFAIASGIDIPYLFYRMIVDGDIEEDLMFREGLRARDLLIGDAKFLISVLAGKTNPDYKHGKLATLRSYLDFSSYDADYTLARDDMGPVYAEMVNIVRRKKRMFSAKKGGT